MKLSVILKNLHSDFIVPTAKHSLNVVKRISVPTVASSRGIGTLHGLKIEEAKHNRLSETYIDEAPEEALFESLKRTHPEYWNDYLRRPIEEPLQQTFAADFFKNLNASSPFMEEY